MKIVLKTKEDPLVAKFILILNETPGDFARYSPEEMQSIVGRYRDWRDKLAAADQLLGGQKLTDEGGRHMSRTGSGEVRVVDGPYSEAKEVVGGFFMIQAKDYDDALAISSGCPHLDFGTVSLRQIDEDH